MNISPVMQSYLPNNVAFSGGAGNEGYTLTRDQHHQHLHMAPAIDQEQRHHL